MRRQVMTATEIIRDSSPTIRPYNGTLNPQKTFEEYVHHPEGWSTVTYDPNELDALGPSCVEGLVVYGERGGGPSFHIGVVDQYSLLFDRVQIFVVSALEKELMLHPIDLPSLGKPSYLLIRESSQSPP